jgi:hypothetical protein
MGEPMRASSIEEYLKLDEICEAEERSNLHVQFPHVVVIEGDFPEVAVALRWCWSKFGPRHGDCWNWEYPSCPLVLATERLEMCEIKGKQWEKKVYRSVAAHSHVGEWTLHWLGKTEYDHGFGEFCFANEAQRDAFIRQIPSFDWGENYPWLKD